MSKLTSLHKRLIYAAVIALGIVLDQLTKLLAVNHLKPIGSYPLWEGVFHLTYVENPGAAWGMLKNHPWVFMVFSTISILLLGVYLFIDRSYLSDKNENGEHPALSLFSGIPLAMIVSGGVGNMIDRIGTRIVYDRGFVVDFLDFTLIDFAVFNVADSFVTVGAVLLGVSLCVPVFKELKNKK